MKLFDWTLKLKGFPLSKATQQLKEICNLSAQDFLKYQENKKQEIVAFHKQHNAFYRSFLQRHNKLDVDINNWEDLPIIKKSDMQVPVAHRLSDGYTEKNVYINNTSGSSGTPFFFAKDKFCHALTWAGNMYRFAWHNIDFNASWQARFYGIPLSKLKYYKEKIKDGLSHRVRFPVFDLSDEVCAKYVKKFKKVKFAYLNGYTSSLVLFAKYCLANNIVLKHICPSLKVCVTTSEVCSPSDRLIMENGFGVKVVNEYGAAELGLIAFEDANGNWLVNEEEIFVEILGDDGKKMPDGEEGKVVITALYNKATPLIRYELGDMAVINNSKKIGNNRIMSQVTGRINDIAILPSGKIVPGLTFYYVTKSLLEQGTAIKEFVIKQTASSTFLLEYVADNDILGKEQQNIRLAMDTYLEPGLQLIFTRKMNIIRTKAGKLRQFENLLKKQ